MQMRTTGAALLRAAFAFVAPLLLACMGEYNPFADFSNARVVVTNAAARSGDTLEIFSTFTLEVDIAVKELVDRISISAAGNRLRPRDTLIESAAFAAAPFSLAFSFADTGRHMIVLAAALTNGGVAADTITLFVRSPLHQNDIAAIAGEPVFLRTPPVRDPDVNYFWSLGGVTLVSSQLCSTAAVLTPARLAGTGALWVSDGRSSSPADSFAFSFRDTAKPLIVCVNEGFIGRDTVLTGDTVFNFKVRITDRLDQWVDSASVNGLPFDAVANRIYSKLFGRMHRYSAASPLKLTVYALDHYAAGNEATATFWVVFSDTAPRASAAEIVVVSPHVDPFITSMRRIAIAGVVVNRSLDSLDLSLSATVRGAPLARQHRITAAAPWWEWEIELDSGDNPIRITAINNLAFGIVDQIQRTVRCVFELPDTAPPTVVRILADGRDAANLYTSQPSVVLSVEAYDEASGIESLTINGVPIPSANGRWYYDTIALAHVPQGNEIAVRAVDSAGNDAVRTVLIFRNRAPVVQSWPSPRSIEAGRRYADTITAFDPDNDPLIFEKVAGPIGLAVSNTGALAWVPAQADTGSQSITLRVWDGYQPVVRTYLLYVYPQGGMPPAPLAFATAAGDFPPFLEAGVDTLRITLRVAPQTGVKPFFFSAAILGRGAILLPFGRDSVLTWAPQVRDTGFAQIMAIVRDAFPQYDTLFSRILVAPPNRPCDLTAHFTGDTLPGGALNMNARQGPDTLVFRIHDADNSAIEWHSITIRQFRTQWVQHIDSAVVESLSIAIDPAAFDGYDTITVAIRDRAGHTDTLKKAVYYGMPPYAPQAVSPVNYSSVAGPSVMLSWRCSDPDGDSLRYDVYFGTNAQNLIKQGSVDSASFPVSNLRPATTYYWRIVARDWKSFTTGTVWEFQTR